MGLHVVADGGVALNPVLAEVLSAVLLLVVLRRGWVPAPSRTCTPARTCPTPRRCCCRYRT
jgi:hypothetical protein